MGLFGLRLIFRRGILALFLAFVIVGHSAAFAQRGRPAPHRELPTGERHIDIHGSKSSRDFGSRSGKEPTPSLSKISSIPLPETLHPLLRDVWGTARDVHTVKDTENSEGWRYGSIGDQEHPVLYRLDADPRKTEQINRYLSAQINPKMALLPLFDPKASFGIIRKLRKAWSGEVFKDRINIRDIEDFFAAHKGETVILVSHIDATTRSFDVLGADNKVVASFPADKIAMTAGLNQVTLAIIGCSSLHLGQGVGVTKPITTNEVAAILPSLLAARTRFDLHRLISTPDNKVVIDPDLLFTTLYSLHIEVIQRQGNAIVVVIPPPNLSFGNRPALCIESPVGRQQCMRFRFDPMFDDISYRAVDHEAQQAEYVSARSAALFREAKIAGEAAAAAASIDDADEVENESSFFSNLLEIVLVTAAVLGVVCFMIGLIAAVFGFFEFARTKK